MSTQPIIPMTKNQYNKLATIVDQNPGCKILVCEYDNVIDNGIEWGSEDNGSPDPNKFVDFIHPIHALRYFGLGHEATIEADPSGSQWHIFSEYMDRIISGVVRLLIFTDDPSPVEFAAIQSEGERQVGKAYGWGAIIGFGVAKLFENTFIGTWWRNNKWETPWCDRNSPVCSQGVKLQDDNTTRLYHLYEDLFWKNASPQKLLDEQFAKKTKLVLDSFAFAKLTA